MGLKTLAWLLIPLCGLLELGAHFFFATRAPDVPEWEALRETVAEMRTGDELIVVAPRWAEPNARHAFGDALMPLEQVARPDTSAVARAIEVSILGATSPDLAGFRVAEERRHGKFRLRVLDNPDAAKVEFDFVDAVADAKVADLSGKDEKACRYRARVRSSAGGLHGHPAFPKARHDCPGPSWHFVGATVVEDDQWLPRRCLWAHPLGNKTLSIRFERVPVGSVVRGYATLPYWLEREKKGSPVEMEVRVDGRSLGTYVHRDGDGWKPFSFDTGVAGKRASVEFRIRSDRAHHRQYCFYADTR